jgi:hypothetical protein
MKKNRLQLWMVAGSLMLLLSSCLGGNNIDLDEWHLSNCQISTFSLSNDSIPGLNDVEFTIDQINGLIFNKDSMPYGTVIDRKAVCTITYVIGAVSAVEVYQEATGESNYNWNGTDSLDFSGFVRFHVYSYDGKEVKTYVATLNVHQQHPDSMTWTRHADHLLGKNVQEQKVIARNDEYRMYVKDADGYGLYRSPATDAVTWTPLPLTGLSGKTFLLSQITEYEGVLYLPASDGSLYQSANGQDWTNVASAPAVTALLGTVEAGTTVKQPSALTAIIRNGDTWSFAAMGADLQWKTGEAVPPDFPVAGFGSTCYEVMYYRHLVVVAGKDRNGQLGNVSWDTVDGLSWIRLTDENASFYEKREGIMLTQYDSKLFLIGGINAADQATKDIYLSRDKGITWSLADTLIILPETYPARGYASVLVDREQFILLFGGKESNHADVADELWRGRINRLGFKE